MQKLINADSPKRKVKKGLVIAAVLAFILVGVLVWYVLEQRLPATAREECSRDPVDPQGCIEREKQLQDTCARLTGDAFHDCAAGIVYKELDEPQITETTGTLTD